MNLRKFFKIIFCMTLCMTQAFSTVFSASAETFFEEAVEQNAFEQAIEENYFEEAAKEDILENDIEEEIPEDFVMELSEKASEGVDPDGYYVLNLSAETIAESPKKFSTLIQALLNDARDHATDKLPYKIIVEAGSYTLTKALHIYSNTYLSLDGVTLTMGATSNILRVGTGSDTNTGYYFHNITIDGGKRGCVLDKNCSAYPTSGTTGVKICHTKNFLMNNVTLTNAKNVHLMEVAGVKNFTLKRCTFQNMTVSNGYYEAVQIDILVPGHIGGFAYETLANQNLTFDHCMFYNVPRAIGSHTSVLNCPVTDLTIQNCTFTKTASDAVRLVGVKRFTATDNNFTNVPCAISLHSVHPGGTYLPSAVAAFGNTTTTLPDTYKKPAKNQKIVIKGNYINCSGQDAFRGSSEECAIMVTGYDFTNGYSGTNPIPAGNYYISGITITDNDISAGNGMILNNVRNVTVSKNKLYHSGSPQKDYRNGICAWNGCKTLTFSNNKIQYFPTSGIYCDASSDINITNNNILPKGDGIRLSVSSGCTLKSNTINNMGVDNPKNHGINVENHSSADNIKSNTILNYRGNGISVTGGSTVETISKNTIKSAATSGISVEWATVTNIKQNTIQNSCKAQTRGAIYIGGGGKVSSLSKNTIKNSYWFGIQVDVGEVTDIASNTIKSPANYGIVIYSGQYGSASVNTVRSNTLTNGKDIGIYIANTRDGITLSSNTVKKCETAQIYINRTASPYANITGNTLTGKADADGIRIDGGSVNLSSNNLISCRFAVLLKNAGIKADIQPNTYRNNKYNSANYYYKNKFISYALHPDAPSFLNAAAAGKTKVNLSWNAVNNVKGYLIYYSTKKGSGYTLLKKVSAKKTSFTVKKLKKNTKYYFKVAAYTKSPDGCVRICSKDSPIVYQTTSN